MTSTANQPHYLQRFGFSQAPFRLSPDPFFYYPSRTHVSAEKILAHAISSGEGFMVLSGQAGLGKTLLLKKIISGIQEHKVPLVILSPAVDATGLLQLLLAELGVSYQPTDGLALLLQKFQAQTLEIAKQGKELCIIVDEAHNMPVATIEQLRMLSNLETGKKKLLQILLVGQSELDTVLRDPGLGQLVQRIVLHEKLTPLKGEEITRYIHFRLQKAGRPDLSLSNSGCRLIGKKSRGIPRLINRIMDRTLLFASVDPRGALHNRHIRAALGSMEDLRRPRGLSWQSPGNYLTLLVLLALLFYALTTLEAVEGFWQGLPAVQMIKEFADGFLTLVDPGHLWRIG